MWLKPHQIQNPWHNCIYPLRFSDSQFPSRPPLLYFQPAQFPDPVRVIETRLSLSLFPSNNLAILPSAVALAVGYFHQHTLRLPSWRYPTIFAIYSSINVFYPAQLCSSSTCPCRRTLHLHNQTLIPPLSLPVHSWCYYTYHADEFCRSIKWTNPWMQCVLPRTSPRDLIPPLLWPLGCYLKDLCDSPPASWKRV